MVSLLSNSNLLRQSMMRHDSGGQTGPAGSALGESTHSLLNLVSLRGRQPPGGSHRETSAGEESEGRPRTIVQLARNIPELFLSPRRSVASYRVAPPSWKWNAFLFGQSAPNGALYWKRQPACFCCLSSWQRMRLDWLTMDGAPPGDLLARFASSSLQRCWQADLATWTVWVDEPSNMVARDSRPPADAAAADDALAPAGRGSFGVIRQIRRPAHFQCLARNSRAWSSRNAAASVLGRPFRFSAPLRLAYMHGQGFPAICGWGLAVWLADWLAGW